MNFEAAIHDLSKDNSKCAARIWIFEQSSTNKHNIDVAVIAYIILFFVNRYIILILFLYLLTFRVLSSFYISELSNL